MNLRAKPVIELLQLAYPLVEERGHRLFVGVLGDKRTQCQPASRVQPVQQGVVFHRVLQHFGGEAGAGEDLVCQRRRSALVPCLTPPRQEKAGKGDAFKAVGQIVPDGTRTRKTDNVVGMIIVHRVPVAPAGDRHRIAGHVCQPLVIMDIGEYFERLDIETIPIQTVEEAARRFEITAEEEREGMRLEGGEMLCDQGKQTFFSNRVRVGQIEVLDPCFQYQLPICTSHGQIGLDFRLCPVQPRDDS
jgi:hypothetical protein